jgi:hypothetical protein
MTTASALALGTPAFTSSVPGGLPFAFLAKGGSWVSLLVAFVGVSFLFDFVVADLHVGSWVSSSSYDVIPTGAPVQSSQRAVEGSWQEFHHDVSPQFAVPSERIIA